MIFTVIGCVWALSTPLMAVPDEYAHAIRAASIAQGELLGRGELRDPNGFGERRTTVVVVPSPYGELETLPACHQFLPEAPASCAPQLGTDTGLVEATTAAGSYPPTYYVLVGWPSRFLSPTASLYAMRLITAVLCGVMLGWALGAVAAIGRNGFAVIGIGLAATPMVFFMAGSINPNGLEIAAALGLWALLLELVVRREPVTTGQWMRLVTTATLLTVARPLGPLFTVGIAVAIVVFVADRDALRRVVTDRRAWGAAAFLGAVGILSVLWTVKTQAYDSLSAAPHAPIDGPADAFRTSLGQTEYRVRQMIGYFGWLDAPPPFLLEWLWLAGVAVVATLALVVGSMRQRLGVLALLVATIAFPVLSEVQTAEKLGFIWQGRYTLPVGVGVPIVAAWVVGARLRSATTLRIVASVLAIGVAVGNLAGWATMMTRYHSGSSAPLTSFLHWTNTWNAPLGNIVAAALISAALLALGVVLATAASWSPQPMGTPRSSADPSLLIAPERASSPASG